MLKKYKKAISLISLTITMLVILLLNIACAETNSKGERTHTAKIIFSKSETGNLRAVIIHYASDGHSPKSGWTTCDIIDSHIVKIYSQKLRDQERIEGYFTATYKKIEKDKSTPILRYKGELLKIEPWDPEFINDSE